MKNFVIALVSLVSANAMACPNLSGHFLCKAFTNDKDQDVTMVQNMENGIPVYTMTILVKGENPSVRKYFTDNVVRPLVREGYSNYTNQSACVGNELHVAIKGTGSDRDHPDQDGLVIVKIDGSNNMYDSYRGKWGSVNDKFFEETCQRIN